MAYGKSLELKVFDQIHASLPKFIPSVTFEEVEDPITGDVQKVRKHIQGVKYNQGQNGRKRASRKPYGMSWRKWVANK